MSMSHKAFAFDWNAFHGDFAPILRAALDANDVTELAEFIDQERDQLTDPYNGDPLSGDWRSMLEASDVQELADFALTRYYRVREDHGIGPRWLEVSESLPVAQSAALLGKPFGVGNQLFDPGRLGAYFQAPALVVQSLASLAVATGVQLRSFRELLAACAGRQLGVYVTF